MGFRYSTPVTQQVVAVVSRTGFDPRMSSTVASGVGLFVLALLVLALAPAARAATFTAGPSGTYATIQAAVDAALLAGGSNEVRVQQGTYVERITVPSSFASGTLNVTGGWNASFTTRTADSTLTAIDGGSGGTTVTLDSSGGEILFEYFTVTKGSIGGVLSNVSGSGVVRIRNNRIVNNVSDTYGAGVGAYIMNSSQLFLQNNRIAGNTSTGTGTSVAGGGISFSAQDTASFTITGNQVENNVTQSDTSQTTGSGIYAQISGGATGVLNGNTFRANSFEGTAIPAVGVGGAIWQSSGASGTVTMRRNLWIDNENNKGLGTMQLSLIPSGTGRMIFTDSVVAGSMTAGGVSADVRESSTLRLTNLTIAHNDGAAGAVVQGAGTKSLYNSILYANGGGNVFNGVSTGNNLEFDPHFVDSATGDYHLSAPSAALDAGNNSPPGGLGPSDADAGTRVINGTVDIGAYEHPLGAVVTFDPNNDAAVTVADVFYLINHLFAGGPAPIGSGDANGDAMVTVADVFYVINYLFAGGPPPA